MGIPNLRMAVGKTAQPPPVIDVKKISEQEVSKQSRIGWKVVITAILIIGLAIACALLALELKKEKQKQRTLVDVDALRSELDLERKRHGECLSTKDSLEAFLQKLHEVENFEEYQKELVKVGEFTDSKGVVLHKFMELKGKEKELLQKLEDFKPSQRRI